MSVVQKQRVLHLYRHSLKTILNWAVRREVFWSEAASLRKVFESNASVDGPVQIDRLLEKGEAKLRDYAHPDPYTVPYYVGGSKYERNPPLPKLKQEYDFGREGH